MDDDIQKDGAPATRQKNCNICVQAKRRCDRRVPTCTRCANKLIACSYSKPVVSARPGTNLYKPSASPPVMSDQQPMPIGSQFNLATVDYTQDFVMDTCFDAQLSMDPVVNLMDSSVTGKDEGWLFQPEHGPMDERPSSPIDDTIIRAMAKMANACDYVTPWQLYDPTTPLHYIVNRTKDFISNVATDNATPFLHRRLYRDYTPPCILSCFATCVLYANRHSKNLALVMQALHSNSRELVNAETERVVTTPTDKLARCQALFLYQIMRLLDGDVCLRAQGEKDLPLLKRWLGELLRVRDNLSHLAQLEDSAKKRQHPGEWETWIFAESVRRTTIMGHSFIHLYAMMTDPATFDDEGLWNYAHRWTLSRHLWQADSPFEFCRAWNEKPHFVISHYALDQFMGSGSGEDVDDFAEIMLKLYIGNDAANEFMCPTTSDKTQNRQKRSSFHLNRSDSTVCGFSPEYVDLTSKNAT